MTTPIAATMHRADDGSGVLRVSSRYPTGVDDLWDAITNPARLARWICNVEGDLSEGGTIHSVYTSGYQGDSVIERCDPPRQLVISSEEPDGRIARLSATVQPDGDGAVLLVEDTGLTLEDLPFHTAGWVIHLEDLTALVERDESSRDWQGRWQRQVPRFQQLPVH